MSTETGEVQVSWKTEPHGVIWVCRGPDAASVAAHVRELTAFQERMTGDINGAAAVNTLSQQFTVEQVNPTQGTPQGMSGQMGQYAGGANPASQPYTNASAAPQAAYGATPCPISPGAAHQYKEGVGKTGKPYKAIMCNGNPQCAPQWIR